MKENQGLYYTLACVFFLCCIICFWRPLPACEATKHDELAFFTVAADKPCVEALLQEQEYSDDYAWLTLSPAAPGPVEDAVFDLEIVTEIIAYETIHQEDAGLEKGRILTLLEGREGTKELAFHVICVGGREIYRELIAEAVLTEPQDAVVAVGTKPRQPLVVASREKVILPYREEGEASWYGAEFQGSRTSNGEIYDKHEFTAAHPTLPFNTLVKVIYLRNGREVVVRINDRGPHVKGRIIDLSRAAAEEIGLKPHGVGKVRIELLE